MPVLWGDVQHVTRLQQHVRERHPPEPGEPGIIGCLHIHLAGVGVHASLMGVQLWRVLRVIQPDILAANHLQAGQQHSSNLVSTAQQPSVVTLSAK